MEKANILSEVNEIFRSIFQNSSISVTETTTANDIDEWDSLNHAQMISAVEKHFKMKFKLMEIMNFQNVGNMVDTIYQKLA